MHAPPLVVFLAIIILVVATTSALVTAQNPNNEPEFPATTPTMYTVAEDQTETATIATVAATDADSDPLTYSLSGTDSPAFTIDSSGAIRRAGVMLNYETGTSHNVTVNVDDGNGGSASLGITIALTNVDESGSLSVYPERPRSGSAVTGILHDPDGGVTGQTWTWELSNDKGASWIPITGADADSYMPTDTDSGALLRVSATYKDEIGSGRTLQAQSVHSVIAAATSSRIVYETHVDDLTIPWDLAFAPDGTMLFTERRFALYTVPSGGEKSQITADFSDKYSSGETGLMGIVVDPDFSTNRRFYTCQGHTGPEVQVIAWTIDATWATATRVADPLVGGIPAARFHGGCRLRFGPDGYLWITTGDAGDEANPQSKTSLAGKVLRVDAVTGAGAADNPFPVYPLIYTFGHRNPQGLDWRPGTRQMWAVEHGPGKDDEINLLVPGGNYGWDPGPSYNQSVPMTDLTKFPNAVPAKWSSGASTIATSGGVFLRGEWWGGKEGKLAVATLKDRRLRLYTFDSAGQLVEQKTVAALDRTEGRLRSPVIGPDGALYITTSNGSGTDKILRAFPNYPPEFPATTDTTVTVMDDAESTDVLAIVAAIDPDGDSLTYTLGGADAGRFTIDESGRIFRKAAMQFNYATQSRFSLSVTATDPHGSSKAIDVVINVQQPPPPPPHRRPPSAASSAPISTAATAIERPEQSTDV